MTERAQNDRGRERRFFASLRMTGVEARNDRGRERRFFASLRMTEKAQNDRGKKLSF